MAQGAVGRPPRRGRNRCPMWLRPVGPHAPAKLPVSPRTSRNPRATDTACAHKRGNRLTGVFLCLGVTTKATECRAQAGTHTNAAEMAVGARRHGRYHVFCGGQRISAEVSLSTHLTDAQRVSSWRKRTGDTTPCFSPRAASRRRPHRRLETESSTLRLPDGRSPGVRAAPALRDCRPFARRRSIRCCVSCNMRRGDGRVRARVSHSASRRSACKERHRSACEERRRSACKERHRPACEERRRPACEERRRADDRAVLA